MSKHTPEPSGKILEKCCHMVQENNFSFFRVGEHQCNNTAKVIRDGKPYCGIHDPVRLQEVEDKKTAKWKVEYEAKEEINRRREAEKVACKSIPTSDLEAGIVGEMVDGLKKLATMETFHKDTLPTWVDHNNPLTKELIARREFAETLLSKIEENN